jgi:hypothetical protein
MASSVGYVQQQDAFLEQISEFGEEFAGCCMQLNNLCVAFYSFVSNHIFIHEKEWTEALHAFRESVFKSAEGTRTQRRELYDQITTILLNPAATVKHSSGQFGQISRRLSQLLQQGSSNPSSSQKCVACGKTGGVMTECSGRRCTALFHILCAASTLSSKKFKTNFYRCSKCSAVEIKPVKPRKKRNRTDSKPNIGSASGESDGDDCQDASAAAAFSPFSNQSSSHDECSAAKAPTAHPSSSDDDECSGAKHATAPASTPAVDQHPISTFTSISCYNSRDLSTFVDKDNARETDGFLDACEQLSTVTRDTSTFVPDAAPALVQASASVPAAVFAVDQHAILNPTSILSHNSSDLSTNVVNHTALETDVFLDACEQLTSAQSDLSTLQKDMRTGHQPLKANVLQVREALNEIGSAIDKLNKVARGIQSASNISSVPASSDVTEDAIRMLVALDSGLYLNSSQMEQWYEILRNRGKMLSQMYQEKDFKVMVDETIELLNQYSGQQILDDRELAVLHDHLKTYGWVLSPQMWTREEILVMCVILLDPKLLYNNILQKNITADEEKYQNRGMACLDPRVQAIMYSRLKQYKFVLADSHLPIDIPAAVVLNSGGSYLQTGTWEYPLSCRFVVDDTVEALLFEVTEAPAYTCCNGLYIATKTRRPSGEPVYVGISPTQFYGVPKTKQQVWDSVPMKNALSKDHVLHGYFIKKACKDREFGSERVLYWENGKAVFQSVTAYCTNMALLTVDCKTLGERSSPNWSRIENFDFKKKKSIMVAGLAEQRPEISAIQVKGTIKPNYTFACGTERIEVRLKKTVTENRPRRLKKQIFHKDGPTLYDNKQFDGHGNILPDARCYTERSTPLPPGISVSALFAFFCRTFLGIKPVDKVGSKTHAQSCSSGSLRLHASIGRAIIFNFDTDHQVCRHKICKM